MKNFILVVEIFQELCYNKYKQGSKDKWKEAITAQKIKGVVR